MKGISLIIRILLPLSLALFVWAGFMNYSNSLSGHHLTKWDPLLYACLLCIYTIFWTVSNLDKSKETVLGRIGRKEYRAEHALRLAAFFFGGVIIFGVNSEEPLFWVVTVKHLHLIFTATAIVFGYTFILWLPSTWQYRKFWRWVLLGFGGITFFLGFAFDLYSVTWSEFFVALPITFAIYKFIEK